MACLMAGSDGKPMMLDLQISNIFEMQNIARLKLFETIIRRFCREQGWVLMSSHAHLGAHVEDDSLE